MSGFSACLSGLLIVNSVCRTSNAAAAQSQPNVAKGRFASLWDCTIDVSPALSICVCASEGLSVSSRTERLTQFDFHLLTVDWGPVSVRREPACGRILPTLGGNRHACR